MNLEGTKHEKAVLVVMAYIIGFTSGFIAFGVSTMGSLATAEIEPVVLTTPDGSLYTAPTENPPVIDESPTDGKPEIVSYEEGKLYANVGTERFVLSLRTDIMPVENVEGFSTQGLHESLPAYSASADGRYIYFCEQQTATEECTNFVFDVDSSLIQFVSVDGKKFLTPNDVAKTANWEDGTLVIGNYTSGTLDTPWKLALAQ